MLTVVKQMESGRLVCPVSHQPLFIREKQVETKDGLHRYPFVNGVPILFADLQKQKQYLEQEGGGMNSEYLVVQNLLWVRSGFLCAPVSKSFHLEKVLGPRWRWPIWRRIMQKRLCLSVRSND